VTLRRLALGIISTLLAVAVVVPTLAQASSSPGASAAKLHRAGGKVALAWPYSKKGRPADPLARWLARQAGPTCPKPHKKKSRKRCRRLRAHKKAKRGRASAALAVPSVDRGPRRYDAHPIARIAATAPLATPLALTRSYSIPTTDPSYNRLLNWSWTYDSALTAASFVATGAQAQAKQLLDQLAALQFTDGSIDIAFDVSTGQGAGMFRTGTIAAIGLAASKYDARFGVSTYRTMEKKAADYLLTLVGTSGLVRGGPGISWYSTQHNILAYEFLGHLALELNNAGDSAGYLKYGAPAGTIGTAILANMVKDTGTSTHFIQGLGDLAQPLDVQALGAMFEMANDNNTTAANVLTYAKANFTLTGRSIVKSTNVATYNNTYAAAGPFSGYKPYKDTTGPSVIAFDGTPMLRMLTAALGQSTTTLDSWISSWRAVAGTSVGPLQSDQTVSNAAFGVEYHVWPSAASAAWVLLSQSAPTFFTTY
jgi:hypothetical protein